MQATKGVPHYDVHLLLPTSFLFKAHMHNKCSMLCLYEMIVEFEPEIYVQIDDCYSVSHLPIDYCPDGT